MAPPGRLSVELREVAWRAPAAGPAVWRALPERRGVLVRVRDAQGLAGVGEASPLPIESVREADEWAATKEALRAWQAGGGRDVRDADEAFAAAEAACGEAAAARFAVETALCDLVAARRRVAFAEVIGARPAATVPINAVCDARDVEAAKRAAARGIGTIKLKLEPDPAAAPKRAQLKVALILEGEADAAAVTAMRRALGDALKLRGDANRTWGREGVLARLAKLRGLQYVEEPCREFWLVLDRDRRADLPPLGVDESAVGASEEQVAGWMKDPRIGALILKPTRLGLAKSLRWAKLAAQEGKAAVVTHALEGPVAMAACAELARALGGSQPELAVGLDAHPGLAAWPVRAPQIFENEVRAVEEPGLGLAAQWDQLIPTSGS